MPASLSVFVERFLRLLRLPTMPASLSAFVERFLRLLRLPAMPASLSAFVEQFLRLLRMPARPSTFLQPNPRVPVVAPEMPARRIVRQAEMYRARIDGPGARARMQEPASRVIPSGPTIDQLNARDAQIVDPYEQEALHTDYHTIRSTSKSEWDICTVCYFKEPGKGRVNKKNLDRHFDNRHFGQTRKRCRVCTAMFFTQHMKSHIQYCHPGIAVGI